MMIIYMKIAVKDNPKLWEQVKTEIQGNQKWNARMAQQAVKKYKELGGGYIGSKGESLIKWTKEDWGYVKGTKRYLPKKVRDELSSKDIKKEKDKKLGVKKKYNKKINKLMKKNKIY